MNKAILDRMPATPDLNQERLEQLRELMPDLFTNDGALNPDELKRLVDPDPSAEFAHAEKQRLPDPVDHKPRRLLRYAQFPMYLHAGYPL